MKLYKINAENYEDYYGTIENRIDRSYTTTIAQTPNCDAFLFLCKDEQDAQTGLELLDTVPSGFDFTYCQEWGLTINDDVVARVVLDLRKKAYGSWESQLEEIYDDGIDSWKTRIQTIKTNNPKS
ncbi:hypothetical protein PQZ72_02415 [Candidatus Pelagibacter sp.]|nr:hypothetical protein [Candidatus Pelagibacter sp.]